MEQEQVKGVLIPIGGNEDKGIEQSEIYSLDFIDEGILAHVVRESGGQAANVVVIPTASSIPVEVGENYVQAFDTLGVNHVQVLNIKNQLNANKKQTLAAVEQADCVMFSGGDQSRIATHIGGTKLHRLLADRYSNDTFVIAGTSAGAMAMADNMIAGGSSSESLVKGAVSMKRGLGLIPELIVDTHFIRRGRFGRLAEAVAAFPSRLGIGLAEDTGMIIRGGWDMTVIGSGMVIVFDPANLTHNTHTELSDGTPMSMAGLTVHVLSNGDHLSLATRTATVLPMDGEFV